jgi:hypothetical protein
VQWQVHNSGITRESFLWSTQRPELFCSPRDIFSSTKMRLTIFIMTHIGSTEFRGMRPFEAAGCRRVRLKTTRF